MRVTRSSFGHWYVVAVALAATGSPAIAQVTHVDSSFHWSGVPGAGERLVIKTMNGDIRVRGDDVDSIQVRAIKSWKHGDPGAVTVEVTRTREANGSILLCGIWNGATLACEAEGHVINNDGRNDTRLDFEVVVPRRTRVQMATINGHVHMSGLEGVIGASTVNGDVIVAFDKDPDIDLSMSSVNGSFHSDFKTSVGRRLRRGTTDARLGKGGQRVYLSTVNGEFRLVRD